MPAPITDYVPQLAPSEEASRRRRVAFLMWGLAVALVALAVGMVLAAPLARARGAAMLAEVLYGSFRVACHQMPERAFHLEGFPLAVCARCTGLYAGALLGLLLYPLARTLARTDAPPRAALLLAALPTTIDWSLGVFGVWENTHLSRFVTASLLGAASAFYIVPGLVGLGLKPRAHLQPRPPTLNSQPTVYD